MESFQNAPLSAQTSCAWELTPHYMCFYHLLDIYHLRIYHLGLLGSIIEACWDSGVWNTALETAYCDSEDCNTALSFLVVDAIYHREGLWRFKHSPSFPCPSSREAFLLSKNVTVKSRVYGSQW